MSTPHPSKVAGINPALHPQPQTATSDSSDAVAEDASSAAAPASPPRPEPHHGQRGTIFETDLRHVERLAAVQDRLAGWVSDLTTLHELTERLAGTATLDKALRELLRAGASLVGARRGLVALTPRDGQGPHTTVGLGLGPADLGHLETLPHGLALSEHLLDGLPAADSERAELVHRDIAGEDDLDPRHREVAARLGYAASYAVPLVAEATAAAPAVRLGAAVWLYDEPAEPVQRQRHLLGLYLRQAAAHLARHLDLRQARDAVHTVREELLPSRLPRVPGAELAVRHRTGPRGGGDWYDVLPLPEGGVGLAVGAVTGEGPSAVAAMGRLRASLRAYAVMEGEDPVAVLADLELLLRLTEPARSATALFGYVEPAGSVEPLAARPSHPADGTRVVLAGAGHCPPLVVGPGRGAEFVETTLSAPLGMLACWEAPSVEVVLRPDETLLLYTDGLLRRTGEPTDQAFARLHAAAADAPATARRDPDHLVDHVLRTVLPDGRADDPASPEDVVLLAARFRPTGTPAGGR